MIAGAENQALFTGGPWSAVFFGIGISALLWVFRRMILLKRRAGENSDGQHQLRRAKARELIGEIEERAWLNRYRHAIKISRDRPLPPAQREVLRHLTMHQQARSRP